MSGGTGGNRQDNRQRGNAAQLLEKYKSMARDAQLGGDRVQTEYYLQFADHYFRVLSESRSRFEDQRRGQDDEDGDEDDGQDMGESEGQPEAAERPQRRPVRARDDRYEPEARPERQERGNGRARYSQDDGGTDERIAFDVLPPAIGADEVESSPAADDEEENPRPRRRARRPRAEDGEAEIAPVA